MGFFDMYVFFNIFLGGRDRVVGWALFVYREKGTKKSYWEKKMGFHI